jgi:hypothetical protein
MCVDVVVHFTMHLVTMTYQTHIHVYKLFIFSFVCIPYISAVFIHKVHGHIHSHDFGIQ